MRTRGMIGTVAALSVAWMVIGDRTATADPVIASSYQDRLTIEQAASNTGQVTQMALGPDGRLYASRNVGGVISFAYDPNTGALSDRRDVTSISGLGVAFHHGRNEMYLSSRTAIWRLTDDNGDGNWGGPGETRVALVSNIPNGDHDVNQLQIQGDSLYVGIGQRTINGGTGNNTGLFTDDFGGSGMAQGGQGNTFGESAYGGTVSTIRDLSSVPSTTDAARLLGPVDQSTIQADDSPFTSSAVDKLVVHSGGTRNPFGLALDADGHLHFTNNHNRANTNGDGTSDRGLFGDALDDDFRDDVHDQFFRAVEGADYGFRNENWRGDRDPDVIASILDPNDPNYNRVRSITPDNLFSDDPNFLELHDPSNPVGLGPHASANGFDFWYAPLLGSGLFGSAFVTRFTGPVREVSPGSNVLSYRDLVSVDPITGEVRQVVSGFNRPLDVLAVGPHLFVADFGGSGTIYVMTAVPEPSTLILALLAIPSVGLAARARTRARHRQRGGPR